jgi:hypothetical protein
MESKEAKYQCSDCGAGVQPDAEKCPSCGARLEDTESDSELFEIPISSNPIDVASIELILIENNILYSIRDNSMDTVFGLPMGNSPRLIVHKDKIDEVNRLVNNYLEEVGKLNPENRQNSLSGVQGWLLIFCFYLVILNPLILLENILFEIFEPEIYSTIFSQFNLIFIIESVIVVLLVLYGFHAGIKLWRIKPGAVDSANKFLDLFLIYTIISISTLILIFLITELSLDLSTVAAGIVIEDLIISIGFYLIWKSYLKNSIRVQNTYKLN